MDRSIQSRFCSVVATISLAAACLWASPTGSITGFVKDPSGAVVPGAHLALTNLATNVRQETATDSNGFFQFVQLAPAEYSLVAEARGFKKTIVDGVLVQVDQITRVDLTLQLGTVAETVEVTGVTPLLESDKTPIGSVVDSKVVASMPLNARQFLDLALITPGVVPAAPGTQGGGFNVAGARSQSNIYLVDGVSNMDTQVNSPLNNFRIADAVQEFNVQTSVALPEFGRGTGGQVNIVTKSGTNHFHGSAYEYLRNTKFDAADFFTNKLRGRKNVLNRNQFGATGGGPIVKDRTFFFLGYEGFRQVNPQVSSTRVPTDAERATVTDPISKKVLQFWPAANGTGSLNFISNVSSRNSDNTGLVRIDHDFSDRDRVNGRWTKYQGETLTPGPTPFNGGNTNTPGSNSAVINYAHSFSPSWLNEFRVGYSRNTTDIRDQDQGFNAATVFTDASGNPLPGVVDGSKDLINSGLPTINVAGGFARLGSTSNLPQGRITNTYEIFENMSLASPHGWARHTWKWGFHIRREEARRFLNGSVRGNFSFSSFSDFALGLVNRATIRTGSTLAHWRRYPWDLFWQDTFKVSSNLTLNYGFRYEYPSAVSEVFGRGTNFLAGIGPVLFGTNKVLDIDPTKLGPASFVFRDGPVKISDSGTNPDRNNFAPMFGFAYTPRFSKALFGNYQTVIRGGFRVGYDDVFNNIPVNQALNPPWNVTTTQIANVTQPGKFPWAIGFTQNVPLISNFGKQGPGTPTVGVLSFNSFDPNFQSAYMYQYNLGVQRRLGDFSLEADYLGSTGHKLGVFVDLQQPQVIVRDPTKRGPVAPNEQVFPLNHYGTAGQGKDIGNSNYNGFVATAKYQGRRGIFFQGSYTLGKSIDLVNSAFFGSTGEAAAADNHNLKLDRGPSAFDIRHRAVFVYVVDVPAGPGHRLFGWQNPLTRQIFGRWQFSGITTLQSGAPFTVFNTSQDFSGFNQFNDRPDYVCAGRLPQSNGNPDVAFDKSCFRSPPPTGRVGTSGRNAFYGPALQNWDFAVLKTFPLFGEQTRMKFRADFFNLFNHANLALPVSNMSSANFGKITQTVGSAIATSVGTTAGPLGGPRLIQLSLRLEF